MELLKNCLIFLSIDFPSFDKSLTSSDIDFPFLIYQKQLNHVPILHSLSIFFLRIYQPGL